MEGHLFVTGRAQLQCNFTHRDQRRAVPDNRWFVCAVTGAARWRPASPPVIPGDHETLAVILLADLRPHARPALIRSRAQGPNRP
jgi:hypothetical protein